MRKFPAPLLAVATIAWLAAAALAQEVRTYDLPAGARPHDVAPAPDGTVWYTAQRQGALGRLDPATGEVRQLSRPKNTTSTTKSTRPTSSSTSVGSK